MKLSLCIVGCGEYARTVLHGIYDMTEDIQLYFASRDVEKARDYCETYGGQGFFSSYEEAARDSRVEAMYFLTPHHLHLENAALAARHSKHILMEKPIACTISEGREMIRAAQKAGVRLMVAENYRFMPGIDQCKRAMQQGAIGDLRLVQVQMDVHSRPTEWRSSASLRGGGTFIDGGIHCVDALVNLGGFPERVYATLVPSAFPDVESEDGIVVTLRLPGGAVGLISYSTGTPISVQEELISVTGTKGRIGFDPAGPEATLHTVEGGRTTPLPGGIREAMGRRGLMREFLSCVREDREPVMSGQEGLRDLAVVLAAYQSVEQGAEVNVSLP